MNGDATGGYFSRNYSDGHGVEEGKVMVSAEDQALIAKALGGQTAALGELLSRYQDRVYNTVLRLLGNAEDARDVCQDAFLHAFQALESFKGEAKFSTWLFRIAINAAISHKRKHKITLRLQRETGEYSHEPADASRTNRPEFNLELAEEEKRLQSSLNRLTEEHRTVLVMKDLEDMKYEEIAEILSIPIGTVRSRLHRARLELREYFVEHEKQGSASDVGARGS